MNYLMVDICKYLMIMLDVNMPKSGVPVPVPTDRSQLTLLDSNHNNTGEAVLVESKSSAGAFTGSELVNRHYANSLPFTICAGASCDKEINGPDVVVCDACERWFHGACVGVEAQQAPSIAFDVFVCSCCKDGTEVKPQVRRERKVALFSYNHDYYSVAATS